MPELFFTAAAEDAGKRADRFITDNIEGYSRDKIQKLFDDGAVTSAGKPVKKSAKVKENETFEVLLPEEKTVEVIAEDIPINIVYEDESVAVIDKPAGMVVHPAPGNYSGTLVNALLYHIKDLSAINGVIRPGIVHRIDKDTSGLLVIAKTNEAHRALAAAFAQHSITRAYKAYVHGVFTDDSGVIDQPIGRDPKDRKRFAVVGSGGKNAVTGYRVLSSMAGFSLLELRLKTGRTHQIRVHMKHIGHPVVGDKTYGYNREADKLFPGQLLHAFLLGFVSPATGRYMEFESPLPDSFHKMEQFLDSITVDNETRK